MMEPDPSHSDGSNERAMEVLAGLGLPKRRPPVSIGLGGTTDEAIATAQALYASGAITANEIADIIAFLNPLAAGQPEGI